jgi:type III restriction enzyme
VFDEAINKLYVMANESYEDFARALQTEYEEDCGVTFGKVPLTALARITRAVDGEEVPIGKDRAAKIRDALVVQKMLDADGKIGAAFDPRKKGFTLSLPAEYADLEPAVIDLLSAHQIERHLRKDTDEKPNRLEKEVTLSADFVPCGIGSSQGQATGWSSRPTRWPRALSPRSIRWKRSNHRRSR